MNSGNDSSSLEMRNSSVVISVTLVVIMHCLKLHLAIWIYGD